MKYAINTYQVLSVFRNVVSWMVMFAVLLIVVLNSNSIDKSLIWPLLIAFLPVFIVFSILLIQYILFSLKKLYVFEDRIQYKNKPINLSTTRIVKYQSSKKQENSIDYFPWIAGTFYYYKITAELGELFYLTCLMYNRNNGFEHFLRAKGHKVEIWNRAFPLI